MKQKALHSLSFDGGDDYFSATTPTGLSAAGPFAISFWAKHPGTGLVNLFMVSNAAGIGTAYWCDSGTVAGANGVLFQPTLGSLVGLSAVTDVSVWHHWCFIWTGSVGKIYVDGLDKTSSVANSLGITITGKFELSRGLNGGYPSVMNVSHLRIYNRIPTDAEILLLYQGWDIRNGLLGDWQYREGTGTTTADLSGNGNDGTLTNGPTWSSDVPTPLSVGNGGAFF